MTEQQPPAQPKPKRSRVRRALKWFVATVIVLLVIVEIVARVGFGVCDPPLLLQDPQMEYLFAPSQHCRQFGHEISFNSYSMRAPEFSRHKSSPDEFRVMVIGDSIVYGGTKVDQNEVATSRLRDALSKKLNRPVVVGNMAAGSWGPDNMLAYVRRFGLFDADVVVVVLSSHDYADRMTFSGFQNDPDFPVRKPRLALWQIATRYLPRFLAIRREVSHVAPPNGATTAPAEDVRVCMDALRDLIDEAHRSGASRVILAQHWELPEVEGVMMPGHEVILHTARVHGGVEIVQLGPAFKAAIDAGGHPYRDYAHPSAEGQAVIARVLEGEILKSIQTSQPAATAPSAASRPAGF